MMGTPFYYDVYFHDCMWSGTCCIQLRQTDVQQDVKPTILQLQATTTTTTTTTSSSTMPFQISTPTPTLTPTLTPPLQTPSSASALQLITPTSSSSSPASLEPSLASRSKSTLAQHQAAAPKAQSTRSVAQQHAKQSASRATLALHRTQHGRIRPKSAADNKKLRHREVEKNRHRQLQAMVKTLSEQIPGRVDKETQVQTMKRAARYCLYLRDVLNHGQSMNKDKLERLYQRSCENVDLMMDGRQSLD